MPDIPTLYTPRTRGYTDRTPFFVPIIPSVLRAMSVYGIEWTTLKFIEDSPVLLRIAIFVIASLMLGALQYKSWLDFKGRYYFSTIVTVLTAIYFSIVTWSFISFEKPHEYYPSSPVATATIPPRPQASPETPTATKPPLGIDEVQFRNDLRKFILSYLQEQNSALYNVAFTISEVSATTPDKTKYLTSIFNGAIRPTMAGFDALKSRSK